MKRIWIALAILLAILAGTLAHSFYLAGFTRNLTVLLEQAEVHAEQEDWETAAKLTQDAYDRWQKKDLYLHITLRHDETGAIHIGLQEVAEFIQCKEGGEYSAANARLIANLELMVEEEQLSLKNVL